MRTIVGICLLRPDFLAFEGLLAGTNAAFAVIGDVPYLRGPGSHSFEPVQHLTLDKDIIERRNLPNGS